MFPDTGSAAPGTIAVDAGMEALYAAMAASSASTATARPKPSFVSRRGILVRLGRPLQVHQHDDEQVEDDDAAGIDEHLDGREKRRLQQHVQRRDEQEIEHEKQHRVHGVLRRDDEHREPEDERGKRVERYRLTQPLAPTPVAHNTFTMPVTTRFTIASGMSTFHPSRISWS